MARSALMVILAGMVVAAGGLYVSRKCSFGIGCEVGTAIHPAPVMSARPKNDLRSLAPGATICVNPVQNLSDQTVDIGRMDEQLAGEIAKAGYGVARIGDLSCAATTYTEITHVSQGQRVEAELEFRLVLAAEQAPRFSATAKGESDLGGPQEDAIVAAFADQARKIQIAILAVNERE
jgi:hypothetical protein